MEKLTQPFSTKNHVPIHPSSVIHFYELQWSKTPNEQGDYAVVRWDTDENVITDQVTLLLIQSLYRGHSVGDTAQRLHISVSEIVSYINFLIEMGFVKRINNVIVPDLSTQIRPWFSHVHHRWFRWAVSRPILIGCIGFIIIGMYFGFTTPGYIPTFLDYFWSPDLFMVFLVNWVLGDSLAFVHEFAHFFATKAIGGEGKIGISHRLTYIVYETSSYRVATQPKAKRYFIYFAGMLIDILVVATVYWIFKISDTYHYDLGIGRKIMLAIVLIKIESVVWEYNIYMETDVYNFLSDFLNQPNLYLNMIKYLTVKIQTWDTRLFALVKRTFLKYFVNKLALQGGDDLRAFTKKERTQLWFYAMIFVLGIMVTNLTYVVFFLPRDVIFMTQAVANLWGAVYSLDLIDIGKSAFILFFLVVNYIILVILLLKRKKKHV